MDKDWYMYTVHVCILVYPILLRNAPLPCLPNHYKVVSVYIGRLLGVLVACVQHKMRVSYLLSQEMENPRLCCVR